MKDNLSLSPAAAQDSLSETDVLEFEQFEEWLQLTDAIKQRFALDTYHAADLALKYITNRTLQNGLLRGFADDALLSTVADGVLELTYPTQEKSDNQLNTNPQTD